MNQKLIAIGFAACLGCLTQATLAQPTIVRLESPSAPWTLAGIYDTDADGRTVIGSHQLLPGFERPVVWRDRNGVMERADVDLPACATDGSSSPTTISEDGQTLLVNVSRDFGDSCSQPLLVGPQGNIQLPFWGYPGTFGHPKTLIVSREPPYSVVGNGGFAENGVVSVYNVATGEMTPLPLPEPPNEEGGWYNNSFLVGASDDCAVVIGVAFNPINFQLPPQMRVPTVGCVWTNQTLAQVGFSPIAISGDGTVVFGVDVDNTLVSMRDGAVTTTDISYSGILNATSIPFYLQGYSLMVSRKGRGFVLRTPTTSSVITSHGCAASDITSIEEYLQTCGLDLVSWTNLSPQAMNSDGTVMAGVGTFNGVANTGWVIRGLPSLDAISWIHNGSGSWNVASNWCGGRVPGPTDSVLFDVEGAINVVDVPPSIGGVIMRGGEVTLISNAQRVTLDEINVGPFGRLVVAPTADVTQDVIVAEGDVLAMGGRVTGEADIKGTLRVHCKPVIDCIPTHVPNGIWVEGDLEITGTLELETSVAGASTEVSAVIHAGTASLTGELSLVKIGTDVPSVGVSPVPVIWRSRQVGGSFPERMTIDPSGTSGIWMGPGSDRFWAFYESLEPIPKPL